MNHMEKGLRIALLTGMILLAITGFTITTIYAHGHRGGGGAHHSAHPHEHHGAGEHPGSDGTGYYHSHDDQGRHHHECSPVSTTVAPSHENSENEECQNHDGNWEPSQGD